MTEEAENLIYRTDNAKTIMREYTWCIDCRENECPKEFKMVMLLNHWESPFIALRELQKIIYDDENKIKQLRKTDKTIKYKFNAQAYQILITERGKNCLSCTYHSDKHECYRKCFINYEGWKSVTDNCIEVKPSITGGYA